MSEASDLSSERIVVGVDGSDSSKDALRWASRIATATGATIEAVIAWQFPASLGWSSIPEGWDPREDAEKVVINAVDAAFGAQRPAGLSVLTQEGYPSKILLDRSNGAQMLVVGSRGHGGFVGLLLGSVSAACAEHATCPVLVVHGDR
ncbi:MAG TPA: universal stress protein [Jatrophihabitantaceae bacterium]|nr:universal stress protein [Jatrophihabitantaceae bacterium]